MPRAAGSVHVRLRITENQIEKAILDFLRWSGWRAFRMQSGLFSSPYDVRSRITIGEKGIPDWLLMRPMESGECLTFWLETKAPGKKLRPAQEAWIEQARHEGYLVAVADDVDKFREWYRINIQRETHGFNRS